jgi:hypothetical protein
MDWTRLKAWATRQRLAAMLTADLKASWAKHGANVLEEMKKKNPKLYRKMMKGELK